MAAILIRLDRDDLDPILGRPTPGQGCPPPAANAVENRNARMALRVTIDSYGPVRGWVESGMSRSGAGAIAP